MKSFFFFFPPLVDNLFTFLILRSCLSSRAFPMERRTLGARLRSATRKPEAQTESSRWENRRASVFPISHTRADILSLSASACFVPRPHENAGVGRRCEFVILDPPLCFLVLENSVEMLHFDRCGNFVCGGSSITHRWGG